jgi:hypothetical protein
MRPLVEPPPSSRCMCGGELRLKLIEPADRAFGKQIEIFVCTNCSREQTFLADRNPMWLPLHPIRRAFSAIGPSSGWELVRMIGRE